MFNTIRESRKRLYQILSADPDVTSLATGGIIPISSTYAELDRLRLGPHIFYYTQSYQREGYKRIRHRMIVEAHVPFGTYQLNGSDVDAYEYSEALQSAIIAAIETTNHGDGIIVNELAGGLLSGDGFFVWQIIVESVVTSV